MKNTFRSVTRSGLAALALGALCCTGSALAVETKARNDMKPQTGSADKSFIMEAAKGGMSEVEMGKMAAQKGKSAEVKNFGNHMVTDHGKANSELMAIAKKKGIAVNVKADKAKMKDADFDKEYAKAMVKDHEKDVAAFEKEAKSGEDPEVKAFAKKTLPTLRQHLKMAKDMEAKVNKG